MSGIRSYKYSIVKVVLDYGHDNQKMIYNESRVYHMVKFVNIDGPSYQDCYNIVVNKR